MRDTANWNNIITVSTQEVCQRRDKMKNPVAKAWGCVGIMMLGVALFMTSMAFINDETLMYLFIFLGVAVVISGVVLHYKTVRCPHCGSHLGRLYGPRCPFCGEDYKKID